MSVLKGRAYLQKPLSSGTDLRRSILIYDFPKISPFDELEVDVECILCEFNIIDSRDIRVRKLGQRSGFALESFLLCLRKLLQDRVKAFYCHISVKARIASNANPPEAACPDFAFLRLNIPFRHAPPPSWLKIL
jgi:hypothetical protein